MYTAQTNIDRKGDKYAKQNNNNNNTFYNTFYSTFILTDKKEKEIKKQAAMLQQIPGPTPQGHPQRWSVQAVLLLYLNAALYGNI